MMTSRDNARALRARGLSVIPVPLPRPGVPVGVPGDGKVPAIAWREYQTRLAADAEIDTLFATKQNVGIVTGGISEVVVVDPDSPEACRWAARNLPYTPWQTKTPGGGYHLFSATLADLSATALVSKREMVGWSSTRGVMAVL